jgi:hypothetical protein
MAFEIVMAQASFHCERVFVRMGLEALPERILKCPFQMFKKTKKLISIVFQRHIDGVSRACTPVPTRDLL